MNLYTTEIRAIDPRDNQVKTWCGPYVPAISFADARAYCDDNGLGYCVVTGILVAEIDAATGETFDYDISQNN